MHQLTVDPSKTVYNSVEMWQVCPAGREPVSHWRDLEQKRNTETWKNHVKEGKLKVGNNEKFIRAKDQRTCWAEMYIQNSNFFPPFVSFVLLPLTFFIPYYFSKQECHFSFSPLSAPSALLSETSAIISLSYYRRIEGPFMQSVTFRESSDIHGGTAVLVHWYVWAQQISGCEGGGCKTDSQGLGAFDAETTANCRIGREFELLESAEICIIQNYCYYWWMDTDHMQQLHKLNPMFSKKKKKRKKTKKKRW